MSLESIFFTIVKVQVERRFNSFQSRDLRLS